MALRVPNSPPPPEGALFGASSPPNSTPNFISLSGISSTASPRVRGPRTPGMTIALATPAIKRAVLPDMPGGLSSPRAGQSDLAPIPGSPAVDPYNAGPLTPNGARTPTHDRPDHDYFSLVPTQPEQSSASTSAPLPSTTSLATTRGTDPASNPSPLPTPTMTPGAPTGGTLMGRLKMLGKGSKRTTTSSELPTIATTITQPIVDDRPIEEQQQSRVLDSVFSRPLAPCPLVDAPRIRYDPDMAIIISEETSDAWAVKYRGLVGTSYEDMSVLEQKAPLWLLDFLLGNRVNLRDPAKVVSGSFACPQESPLTRSFLPVVRSSALERRISSDLARPSQCVSSLLRVSRARHELTTLRSAGMRV